MGQFFADVHASAASQLGNAPVIWPTLRRSRLCEAHEAMTNCCSWDRHYVINCVITIEVYSKAIELEPDNILAVRQRAARYISTLQPEKAIEDFCGAENLAAMKWIFPYRLGICYYLAENYSAAMAELTRCFPLCDDRNGHCRHLEHPLCMAQRQDTFAAVLQLSGGYAGRSPHCICICYETGS